MPLNGSDREFTPYTAEKVDSLVDQAITHLERQIEQLRSLKGATPEIAMVIGKAHEVFGDLGALWVVRQNQVLQARPLDLIAQGKTDRSSSFSARSSMECVCVSTKGARFRRLWLAVLGGLRRSGNCRRAHDYEAHRRDIGIGRLFAKRTDQPKPRSWLQCSGEGSQ
jgi:hypothetical protein